YPGDPGLHTPASAAAHAAARLRQEQRSGERDPGLQPTQGRLQQRKEHRHPGVSSGRRSTLTMDVVAIFALITKAVTIIQALVSAGQSIAPALEALRKLVTGASQGTVTQADLDATEALLDQQVADFNLDLPPAGT